MVGQKNPSRQPKPLPRAHGAEAPRQNSELRRIERPTLRQQLYRQQEKAVRKDEAPQPGHDASVLTVGVSIKRESRRPENGVCATSLKPVKQHEALLQEKLLVGKNIAIPGTLLNISPHAKPPFELSVDSFEPSVKHPLKGRLD